MATAEANIQKKIRTNKKTSKDENLEDYVEILDENVDAERDNSKVEQIKLSSEEDLESLLKLAEELKEKIDKPENRIRMFRLLQISYLFFPFIFIIFYGFISSDFSSTPYSINIRTIPFIFSILLIFLCEFYIQTHRNRVLPDKLALKEVLQLLREVHSTIAEREDWSILKRAEFRIRLSRFDLSEKKDSVLSFFS